MKVYTITLHSAVNYGAILQSYALQNFLNKQGFESKIIDFCTPNMVYPKLFRINYRNPKSYAIFLLDVLCLPSKNRKWKKFRQFVEKKLQLTERYDSIESLRNHPPVCDAIITGSDQVFNPERPTDEMEAFYLDFTHNIRKISYAASFGSSVIAEKKEEIIRKYLQDFFAISIREMYGVEKVNHILERNCAVQVCDPVFLLDKEDWRRLETPRKDLPEEYILFFNLRNSKSSDIILKDIQEKTGYPVVVLTDSPIKTVKSKYYVHDAGPEEFLWIIDHAQFIVSDSFHGVAFSIIFEKKFIFSDDHTKSNERGLALLGQLHLEHCSYSAYLEKKGMSEIDYQSVSELLGIERENAYTFLNKALSLDERAL